MGKSNKFFDKTNVESRYTGETNYSSLSIPSTFAGSEESLSSLAASLYKELDMITIIANKQILGKEEWSSLSDNSGVDVAALIADLEAKIKSEYVMYAKAMNSGMSFKKSMDKYKREADVLTSKLDELRSNWEAFSAKNSNDRANTASELESNTRYLDRLESDILSNEMDLTGYRDELATLEGKSQGSEVEVRTFSSIKAELQTIKDNINNQYFYTGEGGEPTITYSSLSAMVLAIETLSNSDLISANNFVLFPNEGGEGTTLYGGLYGLVTSLNSMLSVEGEVVVSDVASAAVTGISDIIDGVGFKISGLKANATILEESINRVNRVIAMTMAIIKSYNEEKDSIVRSIGDARSYLKKLLEEYATAQDSYVNNSDSLNNSIKANKMKMDSIYKELALVNAQMDYSEKQIIDLGAQITKLGGKFENPISGEGGGDS